MMLRFGEVSSRSKRWLNTQGFALASEPSFNMPNMPPDITSLHEEDLMRLFSEISSWMDYVEVAMVAAQIDLKHEEASLEEIQAKELIKHKATEKNVSSAKAQVYMNPDYISSKNEVNNLFGRSKMIETIYNSLERKRFLISREISRRKSV